ncbi:uncharacterized protein KY384_003788 [Bacidia gigantensis]|uniref:uncharacterized protein n=1 Tax=Bacidia gigantensis TaxID=2732470 RepID=UPI001D0594F9|nr:uncharacterized protein KY384_003788 [Bacidia gigantensis]KAG8532148.1 hypothetical protein KY384_003788 [Bacidia gigantensis]
MATPSALPSMALTKRSSDSSLMPPPPPPKRIKRPAKVLDEDDYTDALSHIIARDFFPGLLETESKQEYLDAVDSKDPHWIAAAGTKLTEAMTPGADGRRLRGRKGTSFATPVVQRAEETPNGWQGDTPKSVVSTPGASLKSQKQALDTNMSLGAFQRKYTTEDNESFYKLVDKQNQKRAEKYAWMWSNNKIPAARQIAHRKREQRIADAKFTEEAENGKALAKVEPPDSRQAMPDTWKSNPRNGFMFAPESIEDNIQTVAQMKEGGSVAPPKAIVHDNTRIPEILVPEGNGRPPSPTLSAVKDAIAGRPRPTASEASFDGASTPRVNGYAFVDSEEPDPPPPTSEHSNLMLLGTGDSTPNPFVLGESSKREALHHRMVDRLSKSKRATAGRRESELKSQVTPKFLSSPRIEKRGGLTPAAELLLGRVGKQTPQRTHGGVWENREKTPRRSGLRQMLTPKSTK